MSQVVLAGSIRTPIGAFLGTLSDISTVDLGTICAQESIRRANVPVDEIDEVILGHVLAASQGQNPARQVAIKAGLPESVPAIQTSVLCGSGMRSIMDAERAIRCGDVGIVLAGGMESMSRAAHAAQLRKPTGKKFGPIKIDASIADKGLRLGDTMLTDGLMCALTNQHMGNTAENISKKFQISRQDQDAFAAESNRKALEAISKGAFDNELIKVEVNDTIVDKDECPSKISMEEYRSYPTVFDKNGTVTKGNACGLNDGASTLIVASREKAQSLGVNIEATLLGSAMAGLDPNVMGLGPVYAIKKLMKKLKMNIDEIDLFELNEAFAAQSLACVRELNLDPAKVNVNGGSIALGHPIGCSGARIVTTLIGALKQRNLKTGCAALCVGGGMGIAICIRLE